LNCILFLKVKTILVGRMDGGGLYKVQKSIRDNANDMEGYLTDLNAWTLEMKAKELAASHADLVVLREICS